MVLRIHVKKKDFRFEATNLFSISGIVDYDKLDNLLARIKYWIQDEKHYFSMLDCGGVAAFRISDSPTKYTFEKMDNSEDRVPEDGVVAAVCDMTGLTPEQILVRFRGYEVYKPRVFMFSALRFFSGLNTKDIQRKYGYNHATVLNSCKAMAEFMGEDPYVIGLARRMAEKFGNTAYLESATNNKYPRYD
jgi:hypothetical protein